MAEGLEDRPYTLFTLKPLGPVIGAEIEGVDLREHVSPEVKAELHRALLEWKVLFFRNQDITSQQQLNFARQWGELENHPFLPKGAAAEITRFEKDANMKGQENNWHADVTWRLEPSMGAVLRLSEVPPQGGDTLWADMGAAYDNLPDEVKERIDGLKAIHDFTPTFGRSMPAELLALKQAEFPAAEHPVVRTHPETGRKTLFVNRVLRPELSAWMRRKERSFSSTCSVRQKFRNTKCASIGRKIQLRCGITVQPSITLLPIIIQTVA